MAIEIKVPNVGESISEGILARWLKKEGDSVQTGEPVFELETDKATAEVPAPATGLLHIGVREGQTVPIGAVVGSLEEKKRAATAPPPALTKDPRTKESAPAAKETLLSPAARQLAADRGIKPEEITGTGRDGRVIKEDVQVALEKRQAPATVERKPETPSAVIAQPTEASKPSENGRETRQRMSPIRQRIADRLVAAQNSAAILTTFNEADMSAVLALRAKYKEAFQKKHGVGLGFMSFFAKASAEALKAFPVVNAWIDGADVVYHNRYDIGVAVSTEKGLMVPVVHGVDRLSFGQIEKTIAELAQKARDGKIAVADLQGGTFTITNGGIFGSLLSTPILNPPQSAILGMHAIQKRPIAIDDQVVIRPMMYLALSYDHRLIDGREAVSFLVRVKECIESPERLLLEI